MQVVTSENFQQLVETGKVPEFKSPEAPKADAKGVESAKEPVRAADGTFAEVKTDKVDDKAAVVAEDDDGLTPDEKARFTEQISKKIGAKHRQMKEAEEFGGTGAERIDKAVKCRDELIHRRATRGDPQPLRLVRRQPRYCKFVARRSRWAPPD